MMTKYIYYLRHAESTYNKHLTETGIECHNMINSGLSDNGINQAIAFNELNNIIFDLIICSPLKRTHETFSYMSKKLSYKKSIILDLCREYRVNECDFLDGEQVVFETMSELDERIKHFKVYINDISEKIF